MQSRHRLQATTTRAATLLVVLAAVTAACAAQPATATGRPDSSGSAVTPSESQPADVGTAAGDVPDNAVFLPYQDPKLGFSVQYVEGWQVSSAADGVTIRDKDSSETILIVSGQSDIAGYVAATDLPALKAQAGFSLIAQDTVAVGGASLMHLAFHLPAPPDPVTGKRVDSTVDRYYVPGPSGIAIISLSTPDGVDNVDAFRQMIESFRWA